MAAITSKRAADVNAFTTPAADTCRHLRRNRAATKVAESSAAYNVGGKRFRTYVIAADWHARALDGAITAGKIAMGEWIGVAIALVSSCLGGTAAAITRYLVGTADPVTLAILRWE